LAIHPPTSDIREVHVGFMSYANLARPDMHPVHAEAGTLSGIACSLPVHAYTDLLRCRAASAFCQVVTEIEGDLMSALQHERRRELIFVAADSVAAGREQVVFIFMDNGFRVRKALQQGLLGRPERMHRGVLGALMAGRVVEVKEVHAVGASLGET